jgi:hypothetical protein
MCVTFARFIKKGRFNMSLDKNHDDETENVFIEKDGERIVARYQISDKTKIVLIINNQFTSSPVHQIPRKLQVGLGEIVQQGIMPPSIRLIQNSNRVWELREKPKTLV